MASFWRACWLSRHYWYIALGIPDMTLLPQWREVHMTALAKLGLLFAGGLTVGMVIPLSLERNKPAPHSDEAQRERTVTVRCIVEDHRTGEPADPRTGRRLPRPEDEPLTAGAPPQVEVVVRPRP